jgi:hypothetical protein
MTYDVGDKVVNGLPSLDNWMSNVITDIQKR